MHFFGELDDQAIPLDPVRGSVARTAGLSPAAGTDGAGRLHQSGRHQHPAQGAHRASARARYAKVRAVWRPHALSASRSIPRWTRQWLRRRRARWCCSWFCSVAYSERYDAGPAGAL